MVLRDAGKSDGRTSFGTSGAEGPPLPTELQSPSLGCAVLHVGFFHESVSQISIHESVFISSPAADSFLPQ